MTEDEKFEAETRTNAKKFCADLMRLERDNKEAIDELRKKIAERQAAIRKQRKQRIDIIKEYELTDDQVEE